VAETSTVIGPDGWPISNDEPEVEQPLSAASQTEKSVESTQPEEESLPSEDPIKPVSPPVPPNSALPSVSQGYVYQQYLPARLQPSWRDPNVLDVVNPRQWGAGQPTHTDLTQGTSQGDHQVWAADETSAEWRQEVSEQSDPNSNLDLETPASMVDAEVDDAPDRPNSVPPIPPPVTAYISSDEGSSTSTPRQAPAEITDTTPLPPLVTDRSPASEGPLSPPTGPSGNKTKRPTIAHVEVDGQRVQSPPRTPKPRRMYGPAAGGAWWKRDPHPAYSAQFAARRLIVSYVLSTIMIMVY
jgi:hypothetical protein